MHGRVTHPLLGIADCLLRVHLVVCTAHALVEEVVGSVVPEEIFTFLRAERQRRVQHTDGLWEKVQTCSKRNLLVFF